MTAKEYQEVVRKIDVDVDFIYKLIKAGDGIEEVLSTTQLTARQISLLNPAIDFLRELSKIAGLPSPEK